MKLQNSFNVLRQKPFVKQRSKSNQRVVLSKPPASLESASQEQDEQFYFQYPTEPKQELPQQTPRFLSGLDQSQLSGYQ